MRHGRTSIEGAHPGPVAQEISRMRVMIVGLLILIVINGCATVKKTEDLPVPTDGRSIQGGPEGENNMDGL